jgi:hypothetical protein
MSNATLAGIETRPVGWPVSRRLIALYAGALGIALVASGFGVTVAPHLGDRLWEIPVIAPALVVVVALELVRYARWRSARYVVQPTRVFVERGILGPRIVASVDLEGARVDAWGQVANGARVLRLEGLDPAVWDDVAQALRSGGAVVAPDLAPPPARTLQLDARRLALACLLVAVCGALLAWRARSEEEAHAAFDALATSVGRAATSGSDDVTSATGLQLEVMGGRCRHDLAFADEETEMTVLAAEGHGRYSPLVHLRLTRPWSLLPSEAALTVVFESDPRATAVLDAIKARLDHATVRYTIARAMAY